MWWFVLAGLVLLVFCEGCGGSPVQTYRVTHEQMQQMGKIAGIKPCTEGTAIVSGVKRAGSGGIVRVRCVKAF
jgi:hypothetical protein